MGDRSYLRHRLHPRTEWVVEGLQGPLFKVEVSQIIMHEGDEPNAVFDLFDSKGLAGEDGRETGLLAMQAGSRSCRAGICLHRCDPSRWFYDGSCGQVPAQAMLASEVYNRRIVAVIVCSSCALFCADWRLIRKAANRWNFRLLSGPTSGGIFQVSLLDQGIKVNFNFSPKLQILIKFDDAKTCHVPYSETGCRTVFVSGQKIFSGLAQHLIAGSTLAEKIACKAPCPMKRSGRSGSCSVSR